MGKLLLLCVLLCLGCATPPKPATHTPDELARATGFWSPWLLHLHPEPYDRLVVEVDAVEGSEPSEAELAGLRTFLEQYVKKARGVEVAVDEVIPLEAAEGRASVSLALEYLDGPDDERSTFLYVLYFDSEMLSDDTANPMISFLPYPLAIYIDRAYKSAPFGQGMEFDAIAVTHEAGHALGLTRNRKHADGVHCRNDRCLMNAAVSFTVSRLLTFRDPWTQRALCTDCTADLEAYGKVASPENLGFHGPYFVRREKGYQVLSLPGMMYLHVGPADQLDDPRLLELRAKAIDANVSGIHSWTSSSSVEDVKAALPAMLKDPYEKVRRYAVELEKKISARAPQN